MSEVTQQTSVYLNVYDLTPYNAYLDCFGLGAYHSGVEFREQEYGFGMNPVKDQTGVFVLAPGMIAHFRERYYLGEYASDPSNFSQIIQQLEKKYMGRDYDMVNNNCNHFSAELLNHMSFLDGLSELPPDKDSNINVNESTPLSLHSAASSSDDHDSMHYQAEDQKLLDTVHDVNAI